MGFTYHHRVEERGGTAVRLRVWITSPDVLAWGAKAVPKKPVYPGNGPFFAAMVLREACAPGDELAKLFDTLEAPHRASPEEGLPQGLAESVVRQVAFRTITRAEVSEVAGFPAPKHAWTQPANDKARARYDAYWEPWRSWPGAGDPPAGLASFVLTIELKDAKWMPSAWKDGVVGTTAYAAG